MKYTIKDFKKEFPTDEACLEYVFNHRFGKDYPCPKCGKASWHKVAKRKVWACAWCSYQIHPLAGTIFRKSDTSLIYWFFALYKFANSRNGVSAKELERDLGVTYKTAWRIAKQIRTLMDTNNFKLSGIVEVDEAQVHKFKDQKNRRGTPKILGLVQRGGGAKAIVLNKKKKRNIAPIIKMEVEPKSTLFTDGASLYKGKNFPEYGHNSVNHSKGEYSFGNIHINGVEALFSQIKRSISGTYHQISEKHLQAYLDEFAWKLSYSRYGSLFPLLLEQVCRLPSEEV